MKSLYTLLILIIISLSANAQSRSSCTPVWRNVVWGDDLGYKGLLCSDLDADGFDEIVFVCESGLFWVILKYDTVTDDYKRFFVSYYIEGQITPDLNRIYILDSDLDSEPEIVLAFNDRIEIRTGSDLTLEALIDDIVSPYDFFLADADNDGFPEIVVQDYHKTTLLIPGTYQEKLNFPSEAYTYVKCGDVDGDGYNELVYSNQVVVLMPGDTLPEVKWNYNPDETYHIGVTDIDNDGIQEIIRCGANLKVYDGDSLRYADSLGYFSRLLLIEDITGDGNKDILIHEGSDERLLCYNAQDGGIHWVKDSTNWMSPAGFGDTDNDGSNELVMSYYDEYPNYHLRIINPLTMEEEWQNESSSWPIFAKLANVDSDHEQELLLISSYRTTDLPSTTVTILDAATKEIEFHSPAHIFDGSFTGIAINDLDHDGLAEIILCGFTDNYRGKITVLNGNDHSIMSSHVYEDLYSLQTIRVTDINNDGDSEFIVRYYSDILVIDPADYTILKQYHLPGETTLYKLWVGNVDNDENVEIVTIEDKIIIIDTQTDVITKSSDKDFSAISLFDFDNDGIQEIIAGTKYAGKIGIYKGETRLEWLPVLEGSRIDAVAGINGPDDKNMIVFQSNGLIKFMTRGGEILSTYSMDLTTPMEEIETGDYNDDGITEIFASNTYEISEFSADCFPCFFFQGDIEVSGSHCSQDDGSLTINLAAGEPPYSYLWNTGGTAQSINGLAAGDYSINASDSRGCAVSYMAAVPDLNPVATVSYQTPDLTGTSGCEGSAVIEVSNSEPPYYYSIDGSAEVQLNDTIKDLCEGLHQIVITDSFNCMYPFEIVVQGVVGIAGKSEWICRLYPVPASDKAYIEFPQAVTGTATICSLTGVSLITIPLTGQKTELQLSQLEKGAYWLRIILDNGNVITKKMIVSR